MKKLICSAMVMAMCALGASTVFAGSVTFPDGSGGFAKASKVGGADIKDVKVDKAAKTFTVKLPLIGPQRGKRNFEIHATQWYVEKNGWIIDDRPTRETICRLVNIESDWVTVEVPLINKGDAGQYRLRFWGWDEDTGNAWSDKDGFFQNENSIYAVPASNGIKGYEFLVDLTTQTYQAVPGNFAKDVPEPEK